MNYYEGEIRMTHHALQLYNYHVWANKIICKHLKELPSETFRQEIQSAFSSLYEGLVHIYRVDTTWLLAMSGASFDEIIARNGQVMEEVKGRSIPEMEALYEALAGQYRAFFDRQDMDEIREYPHPQFGTLRAPYAEIVQHIVNHGTYHRGNITSMLRQLGHAGTPTDYVFYLYDLNK
jgi:uncharacterized damage-inducible protein DinB